MKEMFYSSNYGYRHSVGIWGSTLIMELSIRLTYQQLNRNPNGGIS
jgi:hypothetical protein